MALRHSAAVLPTLGPSSAPLSLPTKQVLARPVASLHGKPALAPRPQRPPPPATWRSVRHKSRTGLASRTAASASSTPSVANQAEAKQPGNTSRNGEEGGTTSSAQPDSAGETGAGRRRSAVGVISRTVLSLLVALLRLGALGILVYWAFGERVVEAAQWLGFSRGDIIPWAVGLWLMGWVQKGLVHVKRLSEALVVQNGRQADRVLQPGWHWIVPSQEHVCDELISRRTKMIPSRRYVTKDDEDVRVSSTIHYSVFSRHHIGVPTWMEDKVMDDVAAASHAALREQVDELTREEVLKHDWQKVGRTLVDNINTIGGNFQMMATKIDLKIV